MSERARYQHVQRDGPGEGRCLHCGTPVIQRSWRVKMYCSQKCKAQAWNRRQSTACQMCGVAMPGVSHFERKYCRACVSVIHSTASRSRKRQARAFSCRACGLECRSTSNLKLCALCHRLRMKEKYRQYYRNSRARLGLGTMQAPARPRGIGIGQCLSCRGTLPPARYLYCSDRCALNLKNYTKYWRGVKETDTRKELIQTAALLKEFRQVQYVVNGGRINRQRGEVSQ